MNVLDFRGNLDEIDEEGGEDPSIEVSGSQPSHIIYEREANIIINYDELEENLKELDDNDDVRKVSLACLVFTTPKDFRLAG